MLYENTKIFATGAFLQPFEVDFDGKKQWRWIVVGTESPSYYDGKEIRVYDYADTLQGLLIDNDEEE